MTDEVRADLRRGIESAVRSGEVGYVTVSVGGDFPHDEATRIIVHPPNYVAARECPPLDTAQQLALSVLLGDPAALPQALADYLLDQGHEYAAAVAEKAVREERGRVMRLIRSLLSTPDLDRTTADALNLLALHVDKPEDADRLFRAATETAQALTAAFGEFGREVSAVLGPAFEQFYGFIVNRIESEQVSPVRWEGTIEGTYGPVTPPPAPPPPPGNE